MAHSEDGTKNKIIVFRPHIFWGFGEWLSDVYFWIYFQIYFKVALISNAGVVYSPTTSDSVKLADTLFCKWGYWWTRALPQVTLRATGLRSFFIRNQQNLWYSHFIFRKKETINLPHLLALSHYYFNYRHIQDSVKFALTLKRPPHFKNPFFNA